MVIPKTGHDYKKIKAVEPTCKKAGYEMYECSACTKTYKKSIKKLAHDYSIFVKKVEPTTRKDGYEVYKCSMCGSPKTIVLPKKLNEKIKSEEKTQEELLREFDSKIDSIDAAKIEEIKQEIIEKITQGTDDKKQKGTNSKLEPVNKIETIKNLIK